MYLGRYIDKKIYILFILHHNFSRRKFLLFVVQKIITTPSTLNAAANTYSYTTHLISSFYKTIHARNNIGIRSKGCYNFIMIWAKRRNCYRRTTRRETRSVRSSFNNHPHIIYLTTKQSVSFSRKTSFFFSYKTSFTTSYTTRRARNTIASTIEQWSRV